MLYRVLLFVHVLFAAAWVGGGVYNLLLGLSVRASGDPMRMANYGREAGEFGRKYFAPAAVVTVLSGAWLVTEGDWGWGHFWILSAIAVWIYSIISNVTWLTQLSGRIATLTQERGPADADVMAATRTMFTWRMIEGALLIYVIFAMTYKPFTG